MADFALICATARTDHIDAYFAAIKDANANRLAEWNAAVCIQRVWRGHHHREIVRKWKRCALLIEKSYLYVVTTANLSNCSCTVYLACRYHCNIW